MSPSPSKQIFGKPMDTSFARFLLGCRSLAAKRKSYSIRPAATMLAQLAVASRKVIWLFLEQLRLEYVHLRLPHENVRGKTPRKAARQVCACGGPMDQKTKQDRSLTPEITSAANCGCRDGYAMPKNGLTEPRFTANFAGSAFHLGHVGLYGE